MPEFASAVVAGMSRVVGCSQAHVVEAANGDLFFTADRDAGLYRLPRR